MTEHGDRAASRPRRAEHLRALLMRTTVCTEDHHAGVRGEEACERTGEDKLPLFVEEMEERGCVDRGDAAPELGECFDLGQRGSGCLEGSVDGLS